MGEMHGYGRLEFISGDIYEGSMVRNLMDGETIHDHLLIVLVGYLLFDQAWSIYSHFHINNPSSCLADHSSISSPSPPLQNSMPKASFLHFPFPGKGLMRFRNGDVYDGEFQGNKVTGSGQMKYVNGDV